MDGRLAAVSALDLRVIAAARLARV